MRNLHMRKDQWKEPEKFIPERFDPSSEYFLTPSGQKRHPMSFGPFVGGKRICLGKTFAEIMAKVVGSAIISLYDFKFENESYYKGKPRNDLDVVH